ncbi:MAG: 8-oxo-dGTP diphosphatase [Deltaproteobacteria bacterium]|nr:8-oxo-dGTP diphosphatase [Deltaproteobacteria bacterium]
MPYQPILGTLGYILSPDQKKILLIHRNSRPGDEHHGKYNGLGGKIESDEDIVSSMRREILEEAGIYCTEMKLRGTVSWPGFGKNGEDWLGFIFVITKFEGAPFTKNSEGTLEWIEIERFLKMEIPMWEGDKYFIPLLFNHTETQFHGIMPYQNGKPVSWNCSWV